MKNLFFYLFVMLLVLSGRLNAQLNYLFSAASKTYVPVSDGIAPQLISSNPAWEVEDEGFARIPIGFTFNYDGKDYTEANVSVNGFITLGTLFSTGPFFKYFRNFLAWGPMGYQGQRPIIAPFWDDLVIPDPLSLVYKTSGHAPNRVFTIEWKKARWVYESLGPVLSIELKLYEKTNVIEFQYKDEGLLPDPRYAFASIGITSAYNNRDFISLQNTSSHPPISLIKANDSLTVKPANNQMYTFTPAKPDIPESFEKSLKYTNTSVSFNIRTKEDDQHKNGDNQKDNRDNHNEHGDNSFEYAVTTSPIPPASGKNTESGNVKVSSLLPATTYYIYGRSKSDNHKYSQWECDVFTTAIKPVELPYVANIDGVDLSYLPTDMRQQDFQDTAHYYDPSNGWSGYQDFPSSGINFLYYQVDFYDADVWLFTPGIKLSEGKTYQLKFGFLSLFFYAPTDLASLEVKYGRATGEAAMTSGTLFKKTDISSFDFMGGDPATFIPEEKVIEFTPHVSATYYFGFHDLSLMLQGMLCLSNISVTEKTNLLKSADIVLAGKSNNTGNELYWSTRDNKIDTDFEVERSSDGIHFAKIDGPVEALNTGKASKTRTSNNENLKSANVDVLSKKEKTLEVFNAIGLTPELKQGKDGRNHVEMLASAARNNTNATGKISYNFTDTNAAGVNFYRTKQTDQNGKISYSNIVKLQIDGIETVQSVSVYPNPTSDILNVKIGNINTAGINLVIADVSGKIVINKSLEQFNSKSVNPVQLSISKLPAGVFILKLIGNDGRVSATTKFVKQK